MAESTIRFRAESRVVYAYAIIALVREAREGSREFTFGPVDADALEDQGLTVSGPELEKWADDFMGKVPGLRVSDE